MTKCYCKDYPRPQFVRNNWENLNGVWDFAFDDDNLGEDQRWFDAFPQAQTIQVPFTYETKASGIEDTTRHDVVWYRRSLRVDAARLEVEDYVIHFEGSDYLTKVWVNGQYVGYHQGGYARFSFEISKLLHDGENSITIRAEDSFDRQQPRGKQRWRSSNYICWYIQTTGLWKTVWSEYVPKIRLSYVKMTPNLRQECLELEFEIHAPEHRLGGDLMVETVVTLAGEPINRQITSLYSSHVCTRLDVTCGKEDPFHENVNCWTPERPTLYDVQFRILEQDQVLDEVGSYFAMRQISIDGPNVLLNGHPIYQRLILDQGYWEDTHLTPPSEEALIEDIDKIRALGFNGVRKHQKIEDERFLYWCDVKGLLLWSEAPAAYQYSDKAVADFTVQWMEMVKQNYNHPCIIIWVPFNESWGISQVAVRQDQQSFNEAIYYLTKSMDPHRPVIANDGWEHTISDILTLHDYEPSGDKLKSRYLDHKQELLSCQIYHCGDHKAFADGYSYRGQPVILSEYGGIAFDNGESGWGYGKKVDSTQAFVERFDCITTTIKELPYVCGYCYTQVTDVQQEINGLMDIHRQPKVDPEVIREINLRDAGLIIWSK